MRVNQKYTLQEMRTSFSKQRKILEGLCPYSCYSSEISASLKSQEKVSRTSFRLCVVTEIFLMS